MPSTMLSLRIWNIQDQAPKSQSVGDAGCILCLDNVWQAQDVHLVTPDYSTQLYNTYASSLSVSKGGKDESI